jgi:hypothetical protein
VVLTVTLKICRFVPWADVLVLCRSRGTETVLLQSCEVRSDSGSCKCIERRVAAMLYGHHVRPDHAAADEQPPEAGS